jgi:hypothetical protein
MGMIIHRPLAAGALALALIAPAACKKSAPDETSQANPAPGVTAVAPITPTPAASEAPVVPADLRADRLGSRDCATVALFYADALLTRQYQQAARAWREDSGVGGDALKKRFDAMQGVKLDIGEAAEEGAAGSLYCTVQVTLRHDSVAQPGTLTLRRVNDVPGATADQLRWHIVQSTLGETGKAAG